ELNDMPHTRTVLVGQVDAKDGHCEETCFMLRCIRGGEEYSYHDEQEDSMQVVSEHRTWADFIRIPI
ncbi:MAG: hypothetical protein O3A57_12365, partial [Bacteroidetes bacterium]|nr:hypothetical protein [Bacteroidota bacterium]